MLRVMSIVTKTGDGGTTGLLGGSRVSKASPRPNACGSIDELNAALGLVLAEEKIPQKLHEQLIHVQHLLFRVGADIATPMTFPRGSLRLHPRDTEQLEEWLGTMEETLLPLTAFILPGGSRAGALLHLARTVCRRAERFVVELQEKEEINPELLCFINRLGDYLFLAARTVNVAAGQAEIGVSYS